MTEILGAKMLPQQVSSPYEIANLEAHIEAWPIDFDALRRQSDPMTCDASLLDWLRFDAGLQFWNADWPEIKKRRYIRDAWIYQRLQGTPLGVEALLNLAGGRVIEEHLPPDRSFLVPDDGLTHQQILDLMPQLRLYHNHPPAYPNRAEAFLDKSFLDDCSMTGQSGLLFGRYPVIYDPLTGVERPVDATPLAQVGLTISTVQITEPTYGAGACFLDSSFLDDSYLGDPIGPAPFVLNLADPTLTPVKDTSPLPRLTAVLDRSFLDDSFISSDDGEQGAYDRLYLFDPTRVPAILNPARAATFLDDSRFGIDPYNQILVVAIPGTPDLVKQTAAFLDSCFLDAGAFMFDTNDRTNHDFALTAIATARRAGDRILVSLAPSFAGTRDAQLPTMQDL
jgi:phage tail P2-like protein